MKFLCALLAIAAVGAIGVMDVATRTTEGAPACAVSLTLPQSAQTLRVEYRQVGPDLSAYRETDGLDATGLKSLQVQSLLSQGGQLQNDVWLRLGDHVLRPGRWPLGFTLGQHGGMHLFVVDGLDAIPLESHPLEPGWKSPRLAMQWHYLDRGSARLVWHVGGSAGAVHVGLGTDASPDAPPRKPGDAADDATAPR